MRFCEGKGMSARAIFGWDKEHFEEGLVVAYPLQRRGAKI
jgi:hypothetical protein